MKTPEERKEYKRQWMKAYYQRNKHTLLPKQREYQRANAAKARATKRKWIREHPDEWRKYCRDKMRARYQRKHFV